MTRSRPNSRPQPPGLGHVPVEGAAQVWVWLQGSSWVTARQHSAGLVGAFVHQGNELWLASPGPLND